MPLLHVNPSFRASEVQDLSSDSSKLEIRRPCPAPTYSSWFRQVAIFSDINISVNGV